MASKVYLSCAFDHRTMMQSVANEIAQHGYEHTSSWIYEPPLAYNDTNYEAWEKRARANDDFADIRRSDIVVVFTLWPSTTGGLHTELGIAVALDKDVVMVGPMVNMFSYLNVIRHFETLKEFMQAVQDGKL